MKYLVTFNLIGSKYPTQVSITEEQMQRLYQAMQQGVKIVEIDGSYFNTSYFIQAVQDHETNVLESGMKRLPQLESISRTDQVKKAGEKIKEVREKLRSKGLNV